MSRYDAAEDPLCYPGTQILQNKAGLTDQDDLDQFEQLMFLTRSKESPPGGRLDYQRYKAIHHHFFQDVYEWAGQSRKIRTAKGGNWFCYPEYIDSQMDKIFAELATEEYLSTSEDIDVFADRASYYISEINAVHPFREGNGRSQLTLLNILFEMNGYDMDENMLEPDQFNDAMIASFDKHLDLLTGAIKIMMKI